VRLRGVTGVIGTGEVVGVDGFPGLGHGGIDDIDGVAACARGGTRRTRTRHRLTSPSWEDGAVTVRVAVSSQE
jgi:hypothetical protein